jgi:hypothetical protein
VHRIAIGERQLEPVVIGLEREVANIIIGQRIGDRASGWGEADQQHRRIVARQLGIARPGTQPPCQLAPEVRDRRRDGKADRDRGDERGNQPRLRQPRHRRQRQQHQRELASLPQQKSELDRAGHRPAVDQCRHHIERALDRDQPDCR